MLISYFTFAWKKMERLNYITFSIVANVLCVFHMIDIQNYASIIQTIINVGISIYAIVKEKRQTKLRNI